MWGLGDRGEANLETQDTSGTQTRMAEDQEGRALKGESINRLMIQQ